MNGFRPNKGCHTAIKQLSDNIERRKVGYIVDADIKGFFNNEKKGKLGTVLFLPFFNVYFINFGGISNIILKQSNLSVSPDSK